MKLNRLEKNTEFWMGNKVKMIKLINGSDGWKFIDLSETKVDEAFGYLENSTGKVSFFLDSFNCKAGVLDKIANHEKLSILVAVHLLNEWGDISILEKFTQLRELSIGFEKSCFDFSKLSELQSLGGVWSKKWTGLEKCDKLLNFSVSDFTGRVSDIPNIDRLEKISLIQPRFNSLEGIESAKYLESLRIIRASKLTNITSLGAMSLNLSRLEFDKCQKIEKFIGISNLLGLRTLIISDCKRIDSIRFVLPLQQLEVLSLFGTVIQDNDLTPCLKLANLCDFRSEDVRTYVPNVKEVKSSLRKC